MVLVFVAATTVGSFASAAELGTDEQRAAGKKLYEKHCVQCHGEKGDGLGPAAAFFRPPPRDFTSGKFKVRRTANGELPTDDDIKVAIIKGLAFKRDGAFTGMPPWQFADDELSNLVYYIKSFSSDFADPQYNNPKVVSLSSAPPYTDQSAELGRKVFENNECIKCHGNLGRGDGKSAPTLKDDWGFHIRPADLTKRFTFRGGGSREDIFRTVSTGFNGTPMPSYLDSVSEEDRWHLVNYIHSLSLRNTPSYNTADAPILSVYVEQPSLEFTDLSAARKSFESAPSSYIPIVGQVIQPGREFFPLVNELEVRSIYTENEIALLIVWHDIRKDTSGKNAPDMEVPKFEAPKMPVAEAQGTGGDPFAEESAAAASDPFADEAADAPTEASSSQYSDAIAVQFPAVLPAADDFKRPYFILGDEKHPVELWFADLAKAKGELYIGKGSDKLAMSDKSNFTLIAGYNEGEWVAIFSRKREADGSINFPETRFIPIAFSVWDGFNEERGSKRGLTSWFSLFLSPKEKPSVLAPMLIYGGGIFIIEFAIVALVRWNARRREESNV